MNKIIMTLLAVFVAATTYAQTNGLVADATQLPPLPKESKWAVTLGANALTGASDFGGNFTWGGELGLQRKVYLGSINTDLGVRQGVGYGKVGTETSGTVITSDCPCDSGTCYVNTGETKDKDGFILRSELYWDWNLKVYKSLSVFAGPSVSFVYGDICPSWYVGPEGGVKVALSDNVNLVARVNYDFCVQGCGTDDFRFAAGFEFKF